METMRIKVILSVRGSFRVLIKILYRFIEKHYNCIIKNYYTPRRICQWFLLSETEGITDAV